MFFFIERGRRHDGSPADRGVHIHGHHASLSVILSQGRGHGISYSRGWADVYVELRLGRLMLAVSWDLPPPVQAPQPLMTSEHGELLAVVFDEHGRPFSVATHEENGHSHYIFEYCRADRQLYYHLSGFGGPPWAEGGKEHRWWARADLSAGKHVAGVREKNRLDCLPEGWTDPFEHPDQEPMESNVMFCSICDDYFPDDELCEHVFFCDECCWWSTPDDPCEHHAAETTEKEEKHERA